MTEITLKRSHWVVLAAVLMFLVGFFTLVMAISTFTNASWLSGISDAFVGQLWISGVIDLVVFAGCIIAGIFLLQGKKFGFYYAFFFAGINAVKWFFFAFWFPVMGILSIAIDVLIIYALSKSYYYFDDYAKAGLD
jgi:hypothetical protein